MCLMYLCVYIVYINMFVSWRGTCRYNMCMSYVVMCIYCIYGMDICQLEGDLQV